MVRKCRVCKKSWNKTDVRSFYRFPRDLFKCEMWLKNLDLNEEILQTVKDAKACSDHFLPEDLINNISGKFSLEFNAVPFNILTEESCAVNFEVINSNESSDTALENSLNSSNLLKDDIHSSSTILTASSCESIYQETPPKKRKFNRPRYMGDCYTSDMSSPTKAKRNWKIAKNTIKKQRRKISFLQRQNLRLKRKINSLSSLLAHVKENNYISSSAESVIEATLPGSADEVLKRILKGRTHEQYFPLLRSFALTLHFYSPKAYEFVRKTFNDSLPHSRTISKWYSTIEGKPGFSEEAKIATTQKKMCKSCL